MITPEQLEHMKHYIRDNLKRIRKERGLTRNRFANSIGISNETVKRIECGKLPVMVTTYKLIDALKLQPEEI